MRGGRVSDASTAEGGCVFASDEVVFNNSSVYDCKTQSFGYAFGGAIFAKTIKLVDSNVSESQVYGPSTGSYAFGAGIFATSAVSCMNSTISGNTAYGNIAQGGGILSYGSMTFEGCTIDSNRVIKSHDSGIAVVAGIAAFGAGALTLIESTISNNSDDDFSGAIYSSARSPIYLFNSTIASNTNGILSAADIVAHSSIIADNGILDIEFRNFAILRGEKNLVTHTDAQPAAGVITVSSSPRLTPLASRGGRTRTRGLSVSSPAIDQGSNSQNATFDQRGSGFLREVPGGASDIGAYERQADDDELLYSGFD